MTVAGAIFRYSSPVRADRPGRTRKPPYPGSCLENPAVLAHSIGSNVDRNPSTSLQLYSEESIITSATEVRQGLTVFTMPRSALFVIDIQRELAYDPKTQIPHADRIRSAGEKILSAARGIIDQYRTAQKQSPSVIVFVQHEEKPDQGTLVRDTEPWRLVFEPRDGVQEERLVAKTTRQYFPRALGTHIPGE